MIKSNIFSMSKKSYYYAINMRKEKSLNTMWTFVYIKSHGLNQPRLNFSFNQGPQNFSAILFIIDHQGKPSFSDFKSGVHTVFHDKSYNVYELIFFKSSKSVVTL